MWSFAQMPVLDGLCKSERSLGAAKYEFEPAG
jgi:hypothetical protein